MRFLANENFPLPSTRVLRDNGHDVICVGDVMGGATDQAVLSYATEHQLIILTFDRDYGEMLFKYQSISPPAIVYFRLMNYLPADAGSLLLSYLNLHSLLLEGFFTVVESQGVRQRKLRGTQSGTIDDA